MLDRNKLNRVKGILSARLGAEIPKYYGGAKFTKKNPYNVTIYSNDGLSWFTDGTLKNPFSGNIAEFQDVVAPTTSFAIPGSTPITPTTAVENASDLMAKQEEKRSDIEAQERATLLPEVVVTATSPKPSLNAGIPIASDKLQLPSSIQVPELILKQTDLLGEMLKQDKEKKEKRNKVIGTASAITTAAFLGLGTAMGANQTATDSTLTKGANVTYNQITDAVSSLGPTGKIVGTVLKNAAIAGDIIQGLGGGTDQMTSTDKWMDSSFFSWNVGMINGFGGKKADSFAIDLDIASKVGSSYGGTMEDLNSAAAKSGKKYGLFSSSARRKANRQIADAKAKLNLMGDISNEATDLRLAVLSMGEQAGLAYSLMADGGYSQKYTYAAKHGGLLEWNPIILLEWEPQIELNLELPEFKEGGSIDLKEELEWIPELQSGNKIRTIEELIEYAKKQNPRFIQRLSEKPRGIKFTDDEGNEAEGSHYLEWSTDDSGNAIVYPRILEIEDGSLKFFPSNEAYKRAVNNKNILIMSPEEAETFFAKDPEYTTAYKKGWTDFFKKFKNGGSLGDSDIPEIEETNQKNVIPEGALHKNKHYMEHAEGLTKKGIPVIDEDGELQAEIEHSEIIFTLEVTKKLEEYYDIFYSDKTTNKEKELAALDAGKLLVYQILENTEDRTGLIESCKKGGTITFKKSTEDLIEEVLEWMPIITVIEETIEESKKEEPEKKSEKEMMKEAIKEVLIELLTK